MIASVTSSRGTSRCSYHHAANVRMAVEVRPFEAIAASETRDLCELHLLAAGASFDWVALAQAAQAAKDTDVLAAVTECHDETLRTLKWTTYRLKEAAPQALTS